jgi:SAM-dependent methyltransferase
VSLRADERYDAERRQGEAIAAGREAVWGWSTPAGRRRADRRARFLVEAARLGPGARCLELGAGTGEFTDRLVESGCELVALELSEATAAICRDRVGARARVVVGNAETGAGLGDEQFDAVVGVSVLHHLDLELCLRNTVVPRLRPGGRFAFSEPNLVNPQVFVTKRVPVVKRLLHETPHETAFTAGGLRKELERAALVVEVCEPFDFLHPWTPRLLIPAVERLGLALERTPARIVAGSIRVAGIRP